MSKVADKIKEEKENPTAAAEAATRAEKEQAAREAFLAKVKVTKNITLPLIKPRIDQPEFIEVLEPYFTGKKIDDKKEAATLLNVVNLVTGENAQIIVPAVLKGIFDDEYPDNAYVGKKFSVTKHAKQTGKAYHPFSVAEIEV